MIDGKFKNTSFEFFKKNPEVLNAYTDDGNLFNHASLLFLEEKYIEECKRFSKIVDKFKIKKFNSELKIYRENKIELLKDFSNEVELYEQVISGNNIDGLFKSDLSISVEHFEVYKASEEIQFVQQLYILLFLAETTNYYENNFTFKVEINDEEVIKTISFSKYEKFDLLSIYSWIIASKENLSTRLNIVREIIARRKSFNLSKNDLSSAKSAFNRIIKEETDKYFEQVNMLKNDFLMLSERKQESYQALHLKF